MGLWLAASLPALTLVLSFIRFSLQIGRFETCGGMDSACGEGTCPQEELTNNRVVVRAGTSSLDASLQFHRILLSSQQRHKSLAPR